MRNGRRHGDDEQPHLPAERIGDRRPAPLVRDMDDVDAGPQLQQLAGDVRRRAVADRGEMQPARMCLGLCNDILHAVDRRAGVSRDQLRHADDQGHRGEIALDVIVELVEQRIDGVRGKREQEAVTVGRRFRGSLGAHRAAGAAAVLDDDRLSERLRQAILHDARDDIRPPARRVRHDEAHRLCGPVLRPSGNRGEQTQH